MWVIGPMGLLIVNLNIDRSKYMYIKPLVFPEYMYMWIPPVSRPMHCSLLDSETWEKSWTGRAKRPTGLMFVKFFCIMLHQFNLIYEAPNTD